MAFVPDTFVVPLGLVTDQFRLEPLGPQHNAAEYAPRQPSLSATKCVLPGPHSTNYVALNGGGGASVTGRAGRR